MAIIPTSGRDGFLYEGVVALPINSWQFAMQRDRSKYRTSFTQNYPNGRERLPSETLIVTGSYFLIPSEELSLYSLLIPLTKIPFLGQITTLVSTINYQLSPLPWYTWAATFVGVGVNKDFTAASEIKGNPRYCNNGCGDSGVEINGVFASHIRSIAVTQSWAPPDLVTSFSQNHPLPKLGVLDANVSLVVDGDFDFWLNRANNVFISDAIRVFLSISTNVYLGPFAMKVDDVTDLIVNTYTGELISATVNLGAAYG